VIDAPGFAAALRVSNGPQQVVASSPPLAPTTLVLQTLVLQEGAAP